MVNVVMGQDQEVHGVIPCDLEDSVSDDRKVEMLAIFADGFFLAEAELAGMASTKSEDRPRDEPDSGDQPGLFDRD